MKIDLYQVDAFTDSVFKGNSAAVCPLTEWLNDSVMQSIAAENNLSETAFFVRQKDEYHIRWFTPSCEIDLCGHATLAAAYVIFNQLKTNITDTLLFNSKSGLLKVKQVEGLLQLDFPAQMPVKCPTPKSIIDAFNLKPISCHYNQDYLVVFENESDVLHADPDLSQLSRLDLRGVIITAKSSEYDFVNRFFAPNYGIDEDPVTGSAYTQLAPFWAKELNQNSFNAKQVSQRGGELIVELVEDRVLISGKAVLYMKGEIFI